MSRATYLWIINETVNLIYEEKESYENFLDILNQAITTPMKLSAEEQKVELFHNLFDKYGYYKIPEIILSIQAIYNVITSNKNELKYRYMYIMIKSCIDEFMNSLNMRIDTEINLHLQHLAVDYYTRSSLDTVYFDHYIKSNLSNVEFLTGVNIVEDERYIQIVDLTMPIAKNTKDSNNERLSKFYDKIHSNSQRKMENAFKYFSAEDFDAFWFQVSEILDKLCDTDENWQMVKDAMKQKIDKIKAQKKDNNKSYPILEYLNQFNK